MSKASFAGGLLKAPGSAEVVKQAEPEQVKIKYKRTIFDLEADIHTELKLHCVKNGLTFKSTINDAIKDYMKKHNIEIPKQ